MSEKEPLIVKASDDEPKSDKYTYEVIQALFFMTAFTTSLGMLGSASVYNKFGIDSLLAEFYILIFVVITYTINYHMMAYCCARSSEKYNFAEYLENKFGKIGAMVYDILMTIHNVVLLAYVQQQITNSMYNYNGDDNSDDVTHYDFSYYTLALINIPLIFISLTSDFKKVKWFCIVLILAWIYIFTGTTIEVIHEDNYNPNFLSNTGFGSWIIKLIGFQIYFAGAFQSLPFIYKEVKHSSSIKHVINISAVTTLLIFFSIYIYTTFDIENSYEYIKEYGFALIGACSVIVNVIPARFSLSQFLSGNDSEVMKKASGSDRVLSVVLIMSSIVISLFLVDDYIWRQVIGLAVILASLIGILLPPVAYLFNKEILEYFTQKNKIEMAKIIIYLIWAGLLAVAGVVGGFFIMIDDSLTS